MAQEEAYPDERNILKLTQGTPENRHPTVSKSSPIYKTWPYMDEQGILRMRGRIGAAKYAPFEAKYPVILPKRQLVTALVTDFYHRQYRHANRETVVNEMRQRFEVANLRALVRKVANNCAFCKIAKAIPSAPPMAPHSEERLEPFVRPFTYVGVDYFGPVLVRVGRSQMTCFQGANKQLQEEIATLNDVMATTFTNARTAWKFNPPAAPHMGGVWERLVKSVKVAVGSALDTRRKPDDETLKTIIYEAEALVNSRPLTYMPLESAEQESLTPNHFLLGSSTGNKIQPAADVNGYAALRSSWKLAQYITGEFWRRWIREYLPVITRRCKWFENVKELEEGDLALVVNGTGRNQWIRGRVDRVLPGRDGRVRQALVRTATGVLRRPAVKLAVLDVGDQCKPAGPSGDSEHQGLRAGVCNDQAPRYGGAVDKRRRGADQVASISRRTERSVKNPKT
ncbi:uncharacterized protein LOC129729169 [Wyeomyia smithii]|uniref:uncharacterized protein LOC129729169 n=1 Tax=Wyeomyia smithii TaxID=174621 RepID=UPI0024681C12|nr:uncharacterized protein LOC129729169 [Wyeomyia smithii]